MKSSLEQERELSYRLLSEARTEKEGYNSLATRRTLRCRDYLVSHNHTVRLAG